MPRCRVRVLADDDDPDGLHRNSKCPEDVSSIGRVRNAGSAFLLESTGDVSELVRHTTECGKPTGVDTREEVRVHDLVVIRAVNGVGKADNLEERVFSAFR